MIVAVSGPHGSGKSTLVQAMKGSSKLSHLSFAAETTRTILDKGYKLNEEGDVYSQILVMIAQMQTALLNDKVVTTRSIIDGYAYTKVLFEWLKKTGNKKRMLQAKDRSSYEARLGDTLFAFHEMAKLIIPKYTTIFYVPAEFELITDEVRSGNKEYHDMVCKEFNRIFDVLEGRVDPSRYSFSYGIWTEDFIKPARIVRVTGSVEERLKQIEKEIG